MSKNGAVRLEDLPETMQQDIVDALRKSGELVRPKAQRLTNGEVVVAGSRVMEALRKSKAPPHEWYRILGQCQRWCRNPGRMQGKTGKAGKAR